VGDRTMYARIAVEEDDAMLLEEIVWCGDMWPLCVGPTAAPRHLGW
jgi:hypothetical protein